ncbi:MAG: DUF3990 domain-containing protein [Methanosphaera sp.]|nr:DUF3990 domain-containing protein [Methanosphaera sp.]
MEIYHGSSVIVKKPEIRIEKYNKNFYHGFYCTLLEKQAIRWATRFGDGFVNKYDYVVDNSLNILSFDKMTEEWLDFVVDCRSGKAHDYDIIEDPVADDIIYTYVQDFLDGKISREAFWALAKFKYPTHQICFNTEKSLKTISFKGVEKVHDEK